MIIGITTQTPPAPPVRLGDYSGLVSDWNPVQSAVVVDGSNLCSSFSDSAGSNTFLQSSGAAKPTWTASLSLAKGQPALTFAGAQYMQLSLSSQLDYDRSQAWTIGAVVHVTGATADQCILAKGNPISIGYGISCGNGSTVNNIRAGLAASGANRIVADGGGTIKDNTRVILVTYDGSSNASGITMTLNGTAVTVTPTVNSLSSAITSANKFTVGWNAISAYLTGHFLRGFLFSRALSLAERREISAALVRTYVS